MKWKEGNFLKITIAVLILLNIGLIGSQWFGFNKNGKMPPPPDQLIVEVGFSEDQIIEFEEFRKEHHQGGIELKKEIADTRKRFFALLKSENMEEYNRLKIKLGELEQLEMESLYGHFKKVRGICDSEEQKEAFDLIIGRSIPGQNGGPPMRPDGPGRRKGPPHRP